jgi:hypothetical protein
MSWRALLATPAQEGNAYPHNPHNPHNPQNCDPTDRADNPGLTPGALSPQSPESPQMPVRGGSGNIGDSGDKVSPPTPDPAHPVWLVTLPTGERFAARCTPPATLAEVRGWHPTATSLEPEDDTEDLVETGPEALPDIPRDIGTAQASRSAVMCSTCRHWTADPAGDSGLGSCAVNAPASREQGSLWPNSQHRCKAHLEVTPC